MMETNKKYKYIMRGTEEFLESARYIRDMLTDAINTPDENESEKYHDTVVAARNIIRALLDMVEVDQAEKADIRTLTSIVEIDPFTIPREDWAEYARFRMVEQIGELVMDPKLGLANTVFTPGIPIENRTIEQVVTPNGINPKYTTTVQVVKRKECSDE